MKRNGLQKEQRLTGFPLSEGFAVGRVCLYSHAPAVELPLYCVTADGVEGEIERLDNALTVVGTRLEEIAQEVEQRVGKAEAGIFLAQQMILRDPDLLAKIRARIRDERENAETAVVHVLDEYETQLLSLDNEYIKERASDFGEIKRRILDTLGHMNPLSECHDGQPCRRGHNRIVVTDQLTPMLTMDLDTDHLLGLVTERGGYNSHGAILARALGVPAVGSLHGFRNRVQCGDELLINGATGEVVLWPSDETVAQMSAVSPVSFREPTPVDPVPGFTVMANLRTAEDIPEARRMKAEGVGLYRTEIELYRAGRFLDEEELYRTYRAAAESLDGQRILFRLFDIGSDKPLPFLSTPSEENPALGWRGARLLLDNRDLLRAQARALARLASERPTYVMYPMVVDLDQYRELRAAFREAVHDLPDGELHHGVMFEVPAACLQARAILQEAAFASIGTNDLAQYLFAVDRNNEQVAASFTYDKPVFWDMIRSLVDTAAELDRPLSVCGEMGSDPHYIPALIRHGIRTVSVSPRRISLTRTTAKELGLQAVDT